MKVKPLVKTFNTEREIAEYFFNREFDTVALSLIEKEGYDPLNVMMPSTPIIFNEYYNKEELMAEYTEETEETDYTTDEFWEWIEANREFDDYKYGDFQQDHYPMWGWVFRCDEFYVNSDYCDVDKLYNCGIGVIDHEEGYFLFIAGSGYDFYEAHWIPLFKMLNWIEYETEKIK